MDLINAIIYVLFIVNLLGCDEDNQSITGVEQIAGFYKATKFTESGQHDGGVDILANGGVLTAELSSTFTVKGRLVIPENIGSNYAPIDMNYTGTFMVTGDTLNFQNTQTLLDVTIFTIYEKRLETPDMTGRMVRFKIVLEEM